MSEINIREQGKTGKYKVGLVGCGRIAEHHLKFLVQFKNIEIIALCDEFVENAKKLGHRYGIEKILSSYNDLINDYEIDVIHILTPPQYHYDQALKAINKGIHVFIEKPMALSHDETIKLISQAEIMGVKICPNFINLFNPVLIEAMSAIRKIGRASCRERV